MMGGKEEEGGGGGGGRRGRGVREWAGDGDKMQQQVAGAPSVLTVVRRESAVLLVVRRELAVPLAALSSVNGFRRGTWLA